MVSNIFYFIVEYIKLMLVMCGILNYRYKKSFLPIIIFIVSTAMLILFDKSNEPQISWYIYISVVAGCFSIEGKRKILVSFLSFFAISCIDELFGAVFRGILNLTYEELITNRLYFGTFNSISMIILGIITLIIKFTQSKRKSDNAVQNSKISYIIFFTVGQVAALVYISLFNYMDFKGSDKFQITAIVSVCLLSTLFLVFGVLLVYNNNSKRYYMGIARVNNRLLENQEKYYKMLLEKETETRMFRHDMLNHIVCIDALIKEGQYVETEEYLSSLNNSLFELKPKYQTGNILVNSIANDISSKYDSVNLVWLGKMPEQLRLSNMDICIIFSNILDNAFTAASNCKGTVKVTIKSISNSLMIVVENDISSPITEKQGKLLTTKTDKKNHGFGTMNVKSCVNTNGGSVDYRYDDKIFTTEIILPNII